MKPLGLYVAFALLLAEAPTPQPAIPYFSNVRDVSVRPDKQNYLVIDQPIWEHARQDLGDLRLYADAREVPYAVTVQCASSSSLEQPAKILNLGSAQGAAHFLLDTAGVPEYDHVALELNADAQDFVALATVAGSDDDHAGPWVNLGTYTLYDFTREKLGHNFSVKLPPSRFRYLRFSISGLRPNQIAGAKIAMIEARKASWTELNVPPRIEQAGRDTVISWEANEKVPLEGIAFEIEPGEVNFRRTVGVSSIGRDKQEISLAQGAISRVHIMRTGRIVDSENLLLELTAHASNYRITIRNGDDPPLRIVKVRALALERRLYFFLKGQQALRLYYGDSALAAPVYDYAKFFQQDADAAHAQLGPDMHNSAYAGRPDARPWTEKHRWVLWAALLVAILGLGSVALRGLQVPRA